MKFSLIAAAMACLVFPSCASHPPPGPALPRTGKQEWRNDAWTVELHRFPWDYSSDGTKSRSFYHIAHHGAVLDAGSAFSDGETDDEVAEDLVVHPSADGTAVLIWESFGGDGRCANFLLVREGSGGLTATWVVPDDDPKWKGIYNPAPPRVLWITKEMMKYVYESGVQRETRFEKMKQTDHPLLPG